MALYVLPTGRGALRDHCPESYLRATSWLAPKKEANLHTCSTRVCENSWLVQKNRPENKVNTTAKSTNGRDHKKCHCMAQGQFIHSIKYALASKESLKGLQLQASSDWNLAGLWPYGWFVHWLWDADKIMPTGRVRVNLNSEIYRKKSQGTHFLLVLSNVLVIFTTSNLAAWRPAELQVLQHPTHFACSAFKQQNLFTHELTKCPFAYSPRERKKKNK